MILRVERVSKKVMKQSTFTIVCIDKDFKVSFIGFDYYQRCGIKTVLANHTFTTKKYTESNCNNLLKYIRRW